MTYPYGMKNAPAVGGGLGGLPRREAGGAARGETTYAIPGTYSWTCPEGVTSVSVVCVGGGGGSSAHGGGGGGLGYLNNYPVTPGDVYAVTVGQGGKGSFRNTDPGLSGGSSFFVDIPTVSGGGGGGSSQTLGDTAASGGVHTGDGGGNGGAAGTGIGNGGGGGAGGYSGSGGAGGASGSSGAGGGGGGGADRQGGGGVGLFGQGVNGSGSGGGGSGGDDAIAAVNNRSPQLVAGFGGGAGGYHNNVIGSDSYNSSFGASGAVRILWPGDTRQFPSTDVGPS